MPIKTPKMALFPVLLSYTAQWQCKTQRSHFPVQHNSRPPNNYPVDDLDKRDDAEAEKEAKESTKRGDEVNWSHLDPPLKI